MEVSSQHLLSNEYTEVYRRLPLKLQLAYGVGHVLNDVCASMWFTYLLVFFHLVLQFSNWEAGFMLLVGQVADAVSTPFVGFHSDQTDNFWLCRYGRRKTWHLIGTVCVLTTFPFIFAPCINCTDSHKWAQIFYYCVFITIFQFGWASVQISHLSLIPELTPNEHDRTKLTAIRYSFTVVSNLLVYVITWAILHINSGAESKVGPGDADKFQHVVWTGLAIGIVASVIFHVFVKEEGAFGTTNDVRGTQLRTPIKDLLMSLEVYQVAVVYMSTRLFVNLTQVFIPLYLHETLDMTASALALIPLIMFIGSFVTSMTIEKLNRGFGRRLSYILGVLMGISACIWIKLGSGDPLKAYQIHIIAVLIGACGSITLVTSLGITADLIGDKTDSGAFVYGIMSFTDKLANGVAVVIIQDLHKDPTNKSYYRDTLTYVCGGSAILGALAVISLLKKVRVDHLGYENVPNYNSINSSDVHPVVTEEIQPSLIS
ncbi:major facilitator superfamily domain-containing protein 12-like isoform X1 [Zophobas morio]|uniref:major facilitator superfamily domain-containing protein 12-like isoform X1 n=1 Tax=Zophobas morio TaxID=2755281 RepID=UPI003083022B